MSSPDLFDLPGNAPVDRALIKEAREKISGIGTTLMRGKMEEANLIRESVSNGGPASPNEAIINLMQYLNVGIRHLAQKTKVKRKLLVRMIEGHVPMPPEVMTKIHEVFKNKQPSLFPKE